MSSYLDQASALLLSVKGRPLSPGDRVEKTVELSSLILEATLLEKTAEEKNHENRLSRMAEDAQGRAFLTAMTDQCFRSRSMKRTADQLSFLIKKMGVPRFLNEIERMKFLLFRHFGPTFPEFFIPKVRKQLRHEMAHVLLPEEPQSQARYFQRCRQEGVRINLNHLGEAILGEREARHRLETYLSDLANPLIEYISVKISTLYSQINMVGFATTLHILAERLRALYRTAQSHFFKRIDGTVASKFVNLDMEEYRDLDLTVDLFQKVLDEEEFKHFQGGIVLQSYLPDSYKIQQQLTSWAQERVKRGGAPIKIRIVKGANLAMELVESASKGWRQAPFENKTQSDANFRRMLEFGAKKEHAKAAHIGVGSHNLFEIAYALLLRSEQEIEPEMSFEMLAGMAEPLQRVVKKLSGGLLLYSPEAKEKDFQTAVAYLIRRLDENCGEENFLRHFFALSLNNATWQQEINRFKTGCQQIDTLFSGKRRSQNRQSPPSAPDPLAFFHNEPDTDFSLRENREWAMDLLKKESFASDKDVPLVIGGKEFYTLTEPGFDPSCPSTPLYHYHLADIPFIEQALTCAERSFSAWSNLPFAERSDLLGEAAQNFRKRRGELIRAMVANTGKTVQEADPEISEAIDFLEYYRKGWEKQIQIGDVKWSPKGVVLVTPPWNFPCSIPVSGIAAALTAGNTVLFKPAPQSVLVGWEVAKTFWEAGISKEVLQFINCKEDPVGNYLIRHPKISSVILTGATETALKFLKLRPGIDLHAETGGKNAIIITAMSDRDLAIRDLIQSAFGHSGQKCSACSLAILEREVYDDPQFKKQLLDAAESLIVGSAWNASAKVVPLIRPPEGALLKGLTTLESQEWWLLEPRPDSQNPQLWSPGIKWGVQENSFTHLNELFGPVLGVMCAQNLKEAIKLANATPYGLTSGLHSLDEREQELWKREIVAGNLYINRGITGAIVRRQPFGGCKASSFGSGAKAGGPHYVAQFARPQTVSLPSAKGALPSSLLPILNSLSKWGLNEREQQIFKASAQSYAYWAAILKEPRDFAPILGEDNFFYHRPLEKVYVRYDSGSLLPLLQVIAAALCCHTPLDISSSNPLSIPHAAVTVEEPLELIKRAASRIRFLSPAASSVKEAAAAKGLLIHENPVLATGRLELLHYLREISLSQTTHRYGYLPQTK